MQSKKPKPKTQLDENALEAFVSGAEPELKTKASPKQRKELHPWEASDVREDVTKVFNLRLSEPLFLKLKYLAENQKRTSMQSICLDVLEPAIEKQVKNFLKES